MGSVKKSPFASMAPAGRESHARDRRARKAEDLLESGHGGAHQVGADEAGQESVDPHAVGRSSVAAVLVRLTTAALAAAWCPISGEPVVAVTEARVTMAPPLAAMIAGAA